ncbi:PREDICTED: calcitonin gene-related peptide type 1 receptor-like [Priapulus caudatus]|uniref:Calcitonin gene-related peptide type 1 receptor-like n=1 Tax=Priapulus caudatus TaxID=37621 RepID=A0ABM1E9T4_PRICU|nr:PREDICTED: calcitonin gene-related peptide type 1 receptor-like [Priapulus caudatus]
MSKPYPTDGRLYCRVTFDGWGCWDYTLAGTKGNITCPSFVVGFDPAFKAYKECLPNGTWWRHPDTGNPWSNYTTCVNMENLQEKG